MKKKTWFIGASLLGMIVTGSAGVYAGSNLPQIQAFLNNKVGVYVGSSEFKPVDNQGKRYYPITYNNTTYLPVRAVSDALNIPIQFDQASNRILIGAQGGTDGGSISPSPANASQRPQHLPSDFPLPTDFKKIELIENASGSKKNVYFKLQTKQSLTQLVQTYNTYLQQRGYGNIVDVSSTSEIDITATKSQESAVIEGGVIDAQTGLIEYTIIWTAS
ncbi:hypothetical protein [Paenibacillus daejeonensis]|uniref:hypothetical protein n=1 Tax=Paenibacillus daejeonensis TaxID=135193 RepID=UPI0003773326|nr:hypothetical protein [Paenibacillus daejeonensis]